MSQVKVHYSDPRVVALVESGVSMEALASLLVEYRDAVEVWSEHESCADCAACSVLGATLPDPA